MIYILKSGYIEFKWQNKKSRKFNIHFFVYDLEAGYIYLKSWL